MHDAIFAILLVMGGASPAGSDPATLIAELGSPRFTQREAAETKLRQMGRIALPTLKAALESKDPEIRSRAAIIFDQIEERLLTQPTMVNLDFPDTLLVDALSAINQRSGLRLTLSPEAAGLWSGRRLSLQPGGPMTFWEAIDRFCEAAQLHYVLGGRSDFEHGDSTFPLYDGFASSQGMYHDHGPFRIQLTSLRYESEVHFSNEKTNITRAKGGSAAQLAAPKRLDLPSKQFFLQLLVGAEPQLSVAPAGPVKLLEAVDDGGRSLLIPNQNEILNHDSGYLGVNSSPLIHLRVDLAYPEGSANRLKKIKGLIPIIVSTRRPDPLEISLSNATGKSFTQNKVRISVGEIRVGGADQAATIELGIKVGPQASGLTNELGEIHSIASPQQLEICDATGRMIPWFPSSSFSNGEEAKLTLTLLDRGGPTIPAAIRYHGIIRDQTEVPFEFRDLPLP